MPCLPVILLLSTRMKRQSLRLLTNDYSVGIRAHIQRGQFE